MYDPICGNHFKYPIQTTLGIHIAAYLDTVFIKNAECSNICTIYVAAIAGMYYQNYNYYITCNVFSSSYIHTKAAIMIFYKVRNRQMKQFT